MSTRTERPEGKETPIPPGTPRPTVRLVGEDDNVFSIIGKVARAMRAAGAPAAVIAAYKADSMSGDYDHALRQAMRYAEVE